MCVDGVQEGEYAADGVGEAVRAWEESSGKLQSAVDDLLKALKFVRFSEN